MLQLRLVVPPTQQAQRRMPEPLGLVVIAAGQDTDCPQQLRAMLEQQGLALGGGSQGLQQHQGAQGSHLHGGGGSTHQGSHASHGG